MLHPRLPAQGCVLATIVDATDVEGCTAVDSHLWPLACALTGQSFFAARWIPSMLLRSEPRMHRQLGVVALLAIQVILIGKIAWGAWPNRTEIAHMAASVYFWKTQRFDVFCVNPPLTRIVGGLPVIMCRPKCDWSEYRSNRQDRCEMALGIDFVDANSIRNVMWYFRVARLSLIPFITVGGYFGYRLSRELYGDTAGIVFLTMWSFSPFLLAWGSTICPDGVAAAFGLVGVYTFRRWLRDSSWKTAGSAGVCLGVLALTKLTWVIAFCIWPLVWLIWRRRPCVSGDVAFPPLRQLSAILCLGILTINLGYLFDGTFRSMNQYSFVSQSLDAIGSRNEYDVTGSGSRIAMRWLCAFPIPLPADFVYGIDIQRSDFERGLPSYLRGQWADHGCWYYYLYALAVKLPLGTWVLLALATVVSVLHPDYSAPWRDEIVVLAPGVAILIFVSSQTGFSMHSRYVILALPLFFVWISKVGQVFQTRPVATEHNVLAVTVVAALTWTVGSSLWIYPHTLSYFNETVGGPRYGDKHLLGSNIDWGQDLLYLRDWVDSHPTIELDGVALTCSSPTTLARHSELPPPPFGAEMKGSIRVARRRAMQCGPLPGWYAVSVNQIRGRQKEYRYFLRFAPVATAGYSIHIYHISRSEANRVRRDMGLPQLPKDWNRAPE